MYLLSTYYVQRPRPLLLRGIEGRANTQSALTLTLTLTLALALTLTLPLTLTLNPTKGAVIDEEEMDHEMEIEMQSQMQSQRGKAPR